MTKECTPENRCPDMIREMTWGRATRYFTGGGLTLLVVATIISVILQYRGNGSITRLEASFSAMAENMKLVLTEISELKRVQRLQEADTQITRHYINENRKLMGKGPIPERPLRPPTYEDLIGE